MRDRVREVSAEALRGCEARDGRARVNTLERSDVRLRCGLRPGVTMAADYVLDMCLGRAYPVSDCLFLPAHVAGTSGPTSATEPIAGCHDGTVQTGPPVRAK